MRIRSLRSLAPLLPLFALGCGGGGGGGRTSTPLITIPQPEGAFVITDPNDLIGGPASQGAPGDILMRNDRIQAVIKTDTDETGAPKAGGGRSLASIAEYPGAIVDADLVRTDPAEERDLLGGVAPMLNLESTPNPAPPPGGGPAFEIVQDVGTLSVRVTALDDPLHAANLSSVRRVLSRLGLPFPRLAAARDDRNLPVEIVTTYTLASGANYIAIETEVRNVGAEDLRLPVGDYVKAHAPLAQFTPAAGFGSRVTLNFSAPLIAYAGANEAAPVSYGYLAEPVDFTGDGRPEASTALSLDPATLVVHGEDAAQLLNNANPRRLLRPGESLAFRRWLIVGGGDVSEITNTGHEILGDPVGWVEGVVASPRGPVAGAGVTFLTPDLDQDSELDFFTRLIQGFTFVPAAHARTDASGRYRVALPAGLYAAASDIPGHPYAQAGTRPGQPGTRAVSVVAGFTETENFVHPAAGRLLVAVADETGAPLPARVTVVGVDPSRDPVVDLGVRVLFFFFPLFNAGYFADVTDDPLPWGVSRVVFAGADGVAGPVDLEPGTYQVSVSRGPAYSNWLGRAVIAPGDAPTTVAATITRVVDVSGLLAADLNQRSSRSPDARMTPEEQLLANAAEGIDLFVAADRERVTDLAGLAQAMGLSGLVRPVAGASLATFDYGRYTLFPLAADAAVPDWSVADEASPPPPGAGYPSDGAFVDSPRQIYAKARAGALAGGGIIQIERVNDPERGQFALLGVDTKPVPPTSATPAAEVRMDPAEGNRPGVPPGRGLFDPGFDAAELWVGGGNREISRFLTENAGDWFNLLNQGLRVGGTGNSAGRGPVFAPLGSPRNYLLVPGGAPDCDLGCPEVVAAVREGRGFATNGPIVRASVGAATYGDTAAAPGGAATLRVRVESPGWAPFDRIRVFRGTTPQALVNVPQDVVNCVPDGSRVAAGAAPAYGIEGRETAGRSTAAGNLTVTETVVGPAIRGASRFSAETDIQLSGITAPSWIVVVVDGTCGQSAPLFPVVPTDLRSTQNPDLAALEDHAADENGVRAFAFTNPIYVAP